MGYAHEDMAGIYRQGVSDDRLLSVAEHVRGWLFGSAHRLAPAMTKTITPRRPDPTWFPWSLRMRSNLGFAGAVLGIVFLLGPARDARSQEAAAVSAEQALQKLKEGNERFAKDMLERKDVGAARRAALAQGQRPFAVILSCADSRVPPEIIFNQGLGDLFVVRVAGNITDPFILGSIEFAVGQLKAPLVVVLGHESCGAVNARLAKADLPGHLGKLIREIQVGADLPPERAKALPLAIKNNVLHHTALLTQRSDALKDAAARNQVRIVGAVYELSSGKVQWLETK